MGCCRTARTRAALDTPVKVLRFSGALHASATLAAGVAPRATAGKGGCRRQSALATPIRP